MQLSLQTTFTQDFPMVSSLLRALFSGEHLDALDVFVASAACLAKASVPYDSNPKPCRLLTNNHPILL